MKTEPNSSRGIQRWYLTWRGRISGKWIGGLAVVGFLVLASAVWLLVGKTDVEETEQPASETAYPSPEWKIEWQTPLDRTAASDGLLLEASLAAVADAARSKAVQLDDPAWHSALKKRFFWGDQRKAAENAALRVSRNWEIRLAKGITREQYAKLLDQFGIELAVIMPGNKLTYVRDFSKAKPKISVGAADQEKRSYLTWREGELSGADAELMARAGVDVENRVVLTILPATLEESLARMENIHAGKNSNRVLRTRFGIRPARDMFMFYVMEQDLE